MKINMLLPFIYTSGGIRAIFELSNGLVKKGHDVEIIFPLIPPNYFLKDKVNRVNPKKILRELRRYKIKNILRGLKRYNSYNDADWFEFDEKVKFNRLFSFYPQNFFSSKVRDANVSIATAWQTAKFVSNLPNSKGEKYYFVQHYEIWDIWNDERCWKLAEKENSEKLSSINMANITPQDLKEYKKKVDSTYSLDLKKITTSAWEDQIMEELEEESVGSVNYGVNFDRFYPSFETSKTEILALYRNNKHKGDEQVVKSFKKLYKSHPNVNYIMFGKNMPKDLPDFLELHENPSQDKIREIYSRADILVYPSWVEGWGMPPMEAMACRTALVSTVVGAVNYYTPEEGIKLVPIRDSQAIVKEVERLLNNSEEIGKMKERNYKYIQDFTWEKTVDQFENIIKTD